MGEMAGEGDPKRQVANARADRIGAAFSERYRAPLMSFFLRRVGDRAEAEDLVQDVFLRVVDKVDVDALDHPDGFIFQMAANLLKDRARRARTRLDRQPDLENLHAKAEDLTPERVIQGKQELGRVLAALEALPEKTRDMFILRRLEGLKYHEIAELYGVTVSAVEKHVMKALAHLARSIKR